MHSHLPLPFPLARWDRPRGRVAPRAGSVLRHVGDDPAGALLSSVCVGAVGIRSRADDACRSVPAGADGWAKMGWDRALSWLLGSAGLCAAHAQRLRRCRAVQRVVLCCVTGAPAPAVVRHERDGVVAPRLPHVRHDCDGSGEPSPGADVGGASPVLAQMWEVEPSPSADAGGVSPAPGADVAGAAVAECDAPVHPVRAAAGRRVGNVFAEAVEVSGGGRMASPDRVQRRRRRAGAVRADEACRMHPTRPCRAEHGRTCAERAQMRAQVSSVLPPDEDTVARAWAMRPLAEYARAVLPAAERLPPRLLRRSRLLRAAVASAWNAL